MDSALTNTSHVSWILAWLDDANTARSAATASTFEKAAQQNFKTRNIVW